MKNKKILILGGGGFIGGNLAKFLKDKGCHVRVCDIKRHEFMEQEEFCDEFILGDLRDQSTMDLVVENDVDEIYQLAADMGGAGYIFTGANDADIMQNSAKINLNLLDSLVRKSIRPLIFYSSSACIYPEHNQLDPDNPNCIEESAYPANPDSEYGWEKLFSERLYLSYAKNYGMNVKIARFHNIFGPNGTWTGGKEKAPAAMCRKVAEAKNGDEIEVWGDGKQTRSFLYIDECIEGILRLMESNFRGPVNIGSDEIISIQNFARMVIQISGKDLLIKNIEGPLGVRGRNSCNILIKEKLGWSPANPLMEGMEKTYKWISKMVKDQKYIYESPDGGKTIRKRVIT